MLNGDGSMFVFFKVAADLSAGLSAVVSKAEVPEVDVPAAALETMQANAFAGDVERHLKDLGEVRHCRSLI